MARHINLDEAIAHLRNKCYAKYPLSYANGIAASINELRKLPTADVVPKSKYDLAVSEREANVKGFTEELSKVKSEYEAAIIDRNAARLGMIAEHERLKTARADVAKEIFGEIEFDIHQLIFERDETRAIAIEGVIANLKKKYTEGE